MDDITREHRRIWVDALRSGRFEQARGTFIEQVERPLDGGGGAEVTEKHCCLAVATVVAIENGLDTVRLRDYSDGGPTPQVIVEPDDLDGFDVVEYNPDGSAWIWYTDGDLPPHVREWLGFDSDANNPTLDGESAIHRNDSEEQSFEEIAAAIEATP